MRRRWSGGSRGRPPSRSARTGRRPRSAAPSCPGTGSNRRRSPPTSPRPRPARGSAGPVSNEPLSSFSWHLRDLADGEQERVGEAVVGPDPADVDAHGGVGGRGDPELPARRVGADRRDLGRERRDQPGLALEVRAEDGDLGRLAPADPERADRGDLGRLGPGATAATSPTATAKAASGRVMGDDPPGSRRGSEARRAGRRRPSRGGDEAPAPVQRRTRAGPLSSGRPASPRGTNVLRHPLPRCRGSGSG